MPPGVSFRKEQLHGCEAYVFRHIKLGELGRIVVKELPNGHTYLSSEVAGDPDDPATETRKTIFAPLSKQITSIMESMLGIGSMEGTMPPPSPQGNSETVATKLIPCDRCGSNVALLIFADDAVNTGSFEDYARKMYHLYSKLNVHTWIIGSPIGELAESLTPTKVMMVWPNREPIVTMTADELNANLDNLLDKHCQH